MCMYECIYICIYVCIYTIAHVHNQDMLEEFEDVKVGVLAQEEWIRIYIYVLYMYIHSHIYRERERERHTHTPLCHVPHHYATSPPNTRH